MVENKVLVSQQQGNVLFPWKLHEMLQDCEVNGTSDIVSWLPDEKEFKVHKVTEFVGKILPQYFKQTKYKSFQRQLNLWGFERVTENGPEKGAYFHKHFLKEQPALCRFLTRQRAKKGSSRTSAMKMRSSPNRGYSSDDVSSSDESSSFTLNVSCTAKKCTTNPFLPLNTDAIKDENMFLGDLQDGALTFDPLCSDPIFFEGCTFFPLEKDRYEEMSRAVSKIVGPQTLPPKDFQMDLLEELELPSSRRSTTSLIHNVQHGAQLCAV